MNDKILNINIIKIKNINKKQKIDRIPYVNDFKELLKSCNLKYGSWVSSFKIDEKNMKIILKVCTFIYVLF